MAEEKGILHYLAQDKDFVEWIKKDTDEDDTNRIAYGDNASQFAFKDIVREIAEKENINEETLKQTAIDFDAKYFKKGKNNGGK